MICSQRKTSWLKKKNTRSKVGVLLSVIPFFALVSPIAALQPMQSSSYTIQMGNFNMTAGEKSSASYTLTDTVGQIAPGEYTSTGYSVKSGFQYIYGEEEFTFQIADLSIDFGSVTPLSFAQDTHNMSITARSGGYEIEAQADHPLQAGSNTIPFTSCDVICTPTLASAWNTPQNTGFGFNVSGTHASADFINTTYFRPFANAQESEPAAVIASHGSAVIDDVITVTYQLSVSEQQAAGDYSNSITYTAIPMF